MRKWLTILVMALIAVSTSAQEEGEQECYKWVDLTPDESFLYRYVQAMDEASQEAIESFYAEKKDPEDRQILKGDRDRWYVKKDCNLPEGNFFESSFYKMAHENERIYVVLPRIDVDLRSSCKIEGLLEYFGDKVSLGHSSEWSHEGEGGSSYQLVCHMKTSQEVLKAIDDRYDFEKECIIRIEPATYSLETDYDAYLIRVLTGNTEEADVNGEKIISETNWEGLVYPVIWDDYDNPWETTDEGLAIHNPSLKDYMWTEVNTERLALDKDSDYIVRLTLKVPSDGTYRVRLGSWDEIHVDQVPVTASDDFQTFDFEFPEFGSNIYWDGFTLLDTGWVLGTTVVKNVQVIEKEKGAPAAIKTLKANKADDTIYNLAGQKVNASYKGLVIKNGKKMINK